MIDHQDTLTSDLFGGNVRHASFEKSEMEDLRTMVCDVVRRSAHSVVMRQQAKELFSAAVYDLGRMDS